MLKSSLARVRGWAAPRSVLIGAMLSFASISQAQEPAGSIRGVVYDKDFETPLGAARAYLVERDLGVETDARGSYVFAEVPAGVYTLVFSKPGYVRQIRGDVVVPAGQLTEVDAWLAGELVDMDEFVVQDALQLGAGSEAALLQLRFDSPGLLDSIGSDLMSRAGASDAASALTLVSGATVQEGKFAVIRGLPDRYVSSQLNGVRLPSADEDTRAVELDQFPAAVIESVRVSKTFTPDQQGDASGGAVDVRLKGIPDDTVVQFSTQIGYNSQVRFRNDFLTYEGGGVSTFGKDDGGRAPQIDKLGESWDGAVGVSEDDAPIDHKWNLALGGREQLDDDLFVGGLLSLFYERDSSYYDNGIDDSYWVTSPGAQPVPEAKQGAPTPEGGGDFKTALFDVTKASESVQWGGLLTLGVESENHQLGLTYLYTRTAEDATTLAEDTRGKEYYFPGYDVNDPTGPGNKPSDVDAAPYIRTETLDYTERTTSSLQFSGRHRLPAREFDVGRLRFEQPVVDWTVADSRATLEQPDKRQFGTRWIANSLNPGFPPIFPPILNPAQHLDFKPAALSNLGNLQRIFKSIEEESNQYAINLTLPFEQWSESEGYFKLGLFDDRVQRQFDQDTYSNFGDAGSYVADFDELWSEVFPDEDHPIGESLRDVDYRGEQEINAWYAMVDMPITPHVNVVGGARFEKTSISIVNDPESLANYFPEGADGPVELTPGVADVDFRQDDVLPSIGLVVRPTEKVTVRTSYSETVARQTFKELTPILQQEFAGGPIFIGNPDLRMSALKNYDLRVDFVPYEGSLVSASWFKKDIEDAIENVQRKVTFSFTQPFNYPEGELKGFELELRQHLGHFRPALEGLTMGANATFIDSEVTLPEDEAENFAGENIEAPMPTRDATNAPEYLYNLYLTYDLEDAGAQFGLFYTVRGDTLVAGAGVTKIELIPNVYEKAYGTLNASFTKRLGEHFTLKLQAKNLLNPEIEEVYRSDYFDGDVTRSSYTRGREYTIGISYAH